MFRAIDQIPLQEKRVFIRVDFNVPLKEDVIVDDRRIVSSLSTIRYALTQKAKIILASHLGRPKGQVVAACSLLPVAERLSELLDEEVVFPEDCIGDSVKKLIQDLPEGGIMLLENLRFHPEEEANQSHFAEKLASFADVYINDAFGTLHRAHASTHGMVPFFKEKGVGFLVQEEIKFLSMLTTTAPKPFLVILGGSKVSDKISMIEKMMNHAPTFLIGGGMAYTFLKAMGHSIGKSLVEETKVAQAKRILSRAETKGIKIVLPVDSLIAQNFEAHSLYECLPVGVNWHNGMALDIGPKTLGLFKEYIQKAGAIFWNGPMGVYEMSAFQKGTLGVAHAIAEGKSVSVVGGGDSLAAIKASGLEKNFSHLSTGGGASMRFLEGTELPGLKVLEN
ncbi:MAG: phosphoglycerate kinase [Deltaproteobacteria bacterium RIFCSPLOWO2_12_FULL_40_28]|nr:MAG: phosphoglycerate kinase [Deltaproteobacteria bacterium RIFCSPHIGHO2_02_FULL_40_28]OGQ20396.1 MAG: phosphoglycerate kinase [Deltaproteobacteria bacterium RIFCSPHIGHO2_12_FULL_40_32]OGQ41365.1 MAG: phosphoglycerate kinase [Deltaproteobacteria bacterium RIFCSPLOWO2_02_FULL_40_36]OGQ55004.1 MAG: phosphoglycerate kinase [Deltaproteobacteria bacterium RIFCSPLOWO2_12_FULL_40_28]